MDQVTKAVESGIATFTEKYELDAEIVNDLRKYMLEACGSLGKVRVKATKTREEDSEASTKVPRTVRRKTGYNCYIKSQFELSKTASPEATGNSQDLMTRFSKEWQALSAEEKKPYLVQAEEINARASAEAGLEAPVPTERKVSNSGPKKLSGYNVFYRDNKEQIKTSLTGDEKLMTKVGAAWKALSEDEKNVYNTRAKAGEVS